MCKHVLLQVYVCLVKKKSEHAFLVAGGGKVSSRPEEIHNPQKPISEVRVCVTWW